MSRSGFHQPLLLVLLHRLFGGDVAPAGHESDDLGGIDAVPDGVGDGAQGDPVDGDLGRMGHIERGLPKTRLTLAGSL